MQTLLGRTKQKSVVTVGGVQSNHCRGKFKLKKKLKKKFKTNFKKWVAPILIKK